MERGLQLYTNELEMTIFEFTRQGRGHECPCTGLEFFKQDKLNEVLGACYHEVLSLWLTEHEPCELA
jgi:hypothetical protein